MSFESKTVEPERSPIGSPCQNVEKSSGDDTVNSVPFWTGVWRAAQDEWIWYAKNSLVRDLIPTKCTIRDGGRGGRCGGVQGETNGRVSKFPNMVEEIDATRE